MGLQVKNEEYIKGEYQSLGLKGRSTLKLDHLFTSVDLAWLCAGGNSYTQPDGTLFFLIFTYLRGRPH